MNNSPRVGDTPLGTVVVGGLDTVITANLLFNLICKLQGKVNLLTTRAKQNCVFYNGLAFSSESELSGWFTLHNPLGAGCAAMVDFQSIWSYADSDTADSSSWLNDMEKYRKMVLKGGRYEVTYMCWSPIWNEPRTGSGIPKFEVLTNPYPNRFGDPRTGLGSPF